MVTDIYLVLMTVHSTSYGFYFVSIFPVYISCRKTVAFPLLQHRSQIRKTSIYISGFIEIHPRVRHSVVGHQHTDWNERGSSLAAEMEHKYRPALSCHTLELFVNSSHRNISACHSIYIKSSCFSLYSDQLNPYLPWSH